MADEAIAVATYSGDERAWDEFVAATPGSVFFQRTGWRRVLVAEFGFESFDLVARRAGQIVGVLSLCRVGSGRRGVLLSQPFAVEAGACAADADTAMALTDAAVRLALDLGAAYVELRDGWRSAEFESVDGSQAVFRSTLPSSDEEHWNLLPRRRRNAIRRARDLGLTTGVCDVETFHDLYARSVRRLGSPTFAPTYFRRLLAAFADDAVVLGIEADGEPVAAVLSFCHRGVVLPYYAGGSGKSAGVPAHDLMYWELMCLARRRGLVGFDFGRSRVGSGAHEYKRLWGFEPQPLIYRRRAVAGPLPAVSVGGGAIDSARKAWRYVPLPLTKWIGPWLMRRVGVLHT